MSTEGHLTPAFHELLARLKAIPDEATAARGCICGAEVWVFTGRHSGTIWVTHSKGPRPCPREGFECKLAPGTPEPFTEYEELAPELLTEGEIVSCDVAKDQKTTIKDEWDF